ncbi:flagellar protein FlgN [Rossellomorea marisflavi]|uniref:flagellar protein FlgN n=1 Tax=Rossellomorea marisflavi TaxID=189381 RepID=UPI0039BF4893
MSLNALTTTLDRLHKLHISLLDLSKRKTNIIKASEMDQLDGLLKDEQRHLAAIQTVENDRQIHSEQYTESNGRSFDEPPTLLQCMETAPQEEKEELSDWHGKLTAVITELKEQNELNQKLVYQSLQFVNMSLSALQPKDERTNYTRPNDDNKVPAPSRSLFDSKA